MTEEAALRAAIAADPDEDTPRLAYADWLDENKPDRRPSPAASASARAEFIRVQCRLAAGAYHDPDYAELLERHADLTVWLNLHDPDPDAVVNSELRYLANIDIGLSEYDEWDLFHRGFHEILNLSSYVMDSAEGTVEAIADSLESGINRYAARTLRLEDATAEEIARLVRRPVFARLRGLDLDDLDDNNNDTEAVAAIAASRYSGGLRRLALELALDDEACEMLARSSHLGNLESLTITYPISAHSIELLGRAKWFRRLRRLHLWLGYGNELSALAELPPMTRLEALTLNEETTTTTAAVKRFAASTSFPALAHLVLNRTHLSVDQVVALARGRWPLRHLRLESNEVRKSGVEALAAATFATTLQVLELPWCQITAGGIQAMANSESLSGLRRLNLVGNPIGPSGLAAIAESAPLRGLRGLALGLTDTPRGPLAARYVSRFLTQLEMPNLRHLDLDNLPVGIRGAQVLATAKTFANLTRLNLKSCALGESGVQHLIGSKNLSNLVVLDVSGNKTGRGAGKLLNPKVLPKLAKCRLGHAIPKGTATRLRRRPGIVI